MRLLLGIIVALLIFIALIWLNFGRQSVTIYTPQAPPPSILTVTTQPATSPTTVSSTTPPIQSRPTFPDTPPYVTIVDAFPNRGKPTLEATIISSTNLQLHTDGLRHIRLTKAQWPHEVGSSIAINIDGQGIEWTRKRAVLDLVCGQSGGWSVMPETAAATAPVSP